MSYPIQPNIYCENCIKCGQRPVIDQDKKGWEIKCPNDACKNSTKSDIIDLDSWNRLNKKNINLSVDPTVLERSA